MNRCISIITWENIDTTTPILINWNIGHPIVGEHTNTIMIAGFFVLLNIGFIYIVLQQRYKKFTSREYVLAYRMGKLRSKGIGGSFFLQPFIDEIITISKAIQRIDYMVIQPIIFKPHFAKEEIDKKIDEVRISGFLTYQIIDPEAFYDYSNSLSERDIGRDIEDDLIISTNKLLRDVIESHLQSTILEEPLDQLYRNRERIRTIILDILDKYRKKLGLEFQEVRVTKFQL